MSQLKFYAWKIGIKWATVKSVQGKPRIKYTNHLERATIWNLKSEANDFKKQITEKYCIAELVELELVEKR